MSFGRKVNGFLGSPTEAFSGSPGGTLEGVEDETLGAPLKYTLIWLLIDGAISGIVFAVAFATMAASLGLLFLLPGWLAPLGFAIVPIMMGFSAGAGIVALLIGSAWIHLWAYLFGARQGYKQTLKAWAYGQTPSYLALIASSFLFLIPVAGGILGFILMFVAAIWGFVIVVIGLRELHRITTGRAVAAYVLAGVILTIVLFVGFRLAGLW